MNTKTINYFSNKARLLSHFNSIDSQTHNVAAESISKNNEILKLRIAADFISLIQEHEFEENHIDINSKMAHVYRSQRETESKDFSNYAMDPAS
jgi:hypothetical protein